MRDPLIEHGRCEIRERLNRFMELSRREQELIEQIGEAARELAEIRRQCSDEARASAVDAAALLAHVERKERPYDLLAG